MVCPFSGLRMYFVVSTVHKEKLTQKWSQYERWYSEQGSPDDDDAHNAPKKLAPAIATPAIATDAITAPASATLATTTLAAATPAAAQTSTDKRKKAT